MTYDDWKLSTPPDYGEDDDDNWCDCPGCVGAYDDHDDYYADVDEDDLPGAGLDEDVD